MVAVHFNGITVGAMRTIFIMPNDELESHRTILIGVSDYFTAGKVKHRVQLPWQPMTIFAEFDEDFIKHSVNFTGYADRIGLDAEVISVHLLRHSTDDRRVRQLQRDTHDRISFLITKGFARLVPTIWKASASKIRRLLLSYRRNDITVDRLIRRLSPLLSNSGESQQAAFAKIIAQCWQIARDSERQLAKLTQQAFMITHARRVGNSMYILEKYKVLKPLNLPDNDPKKAGDPAYQYQLYQQFLTTQRVLTDAHLPLYEASLQAEFERLNKPYWRPEDLHTYDPLGVLPT
ncbi:hypothetical protein [Lacticaseibacillus sp. GG6-2]